MLWVGKTGPDIAPAMTMTERREIMRCRSEFVTNRSSSEIARRSLVAACMLAVTGSFGLNAGTAEASVWSTTATSGNWSASANWTGGVPNGPGMTADFSVAQTAAATTTQDVSGEVIGTLSYSHANTNFSRTITLANAITFNQDGAGTGTATISNTNTSATTGNALIIGAGASSSVVLADDLLISNAGSSMAANGSIQLISTISGTGNLTLSNVANTVTSSTSFAGAIRFQTGTNTFTGNVLIQKGATVFNQAASFGAATNVITIGQANLGSASLFSSGSVTAANNIVVAAGTGGTSLLGSVSTGSSGYSGTVALNGDLSVSSLGTTTFGGIISGTGSLTKLGAGIVNFSNANTFNGTTTVSAGSILLSNALALQNSTLASGATFSSTVTGNTFTFGGLSGSTAITLANNATTPAAVALSVGNNNADTTYAGALTGAGSVTKIGSGTLTFSAANSYTGGLNINNGVVAVASSTYLPNSATTIVGGSTLRFSNPGVLTSTSANRTLVIGSGGGTIDLAGGANVNFTNAITGSGALTISKSSATAGLVFQVQNNNADFTGPVTIASGAALQIGYNGSTSGGIGTGVITDSGTLLFNRTDAFTFANSVNGTGAVTVGSNNTLTKLIGANTYSGTTTVNAGTLQIGDGTTDGTLGTGTVSVASGAILDFNVIGTLANAGGVISGAGALVKDGAGTLFLNQSASNTFSGGLTINGGTVEVATTAPLGSASVPVVINAGTLKFDGTASSTTRTLNFNNANSTLEVASGATFTAGGPVTGTGTFNKTGAGTVFVNNAASNTFSGNYDVIAGALGFGSDAAIGIGAETKTITAAAGTSVAFDSPSAAVAAYSVGANRVLSLTGGTVGLAVGASETWTYNGSITGAGGLSKTNTGALLLATGNTYTGNTTVTSGTVRANNGSSGSATGGGNVAINSGGTLGGNGTVAGSVTVNGGATITAGADTVTTGNLNTGPETWLKSGKYLSKFSEAATTTSGFDTLTMATLDISSLGSANKFGLTLTRATTGGTYTLSTSGVYALATTTGTVALPSGYALPTGTDATDLTALFTLDTTGVGLTDSSPLAVTLVADGGGYDLDVGYAAAPEPATVSLFGLGGATLLGWRRRRRQTGPTGWGCLLGQA